MDEYKIEVLHVLKKVLMVLIFVEFGEEVFGVSQSGFEDHDCVVVVST